MDNKTVTTIAKHRVLPGKEEMFQNWVASISQACQRFSGYMGTEIIRPIERDDHDYACVFRFESFQDLEKWMDSKERKTHMDRLPSIVEGVPDYQQYHSLEFWFEPESTRARPPSRHKMALITFLVIWALVHILVPTIPALLPGPPIFHEIVIVAVIVLLMTYAIMPTITRSLKNWLY